MGLLWEINSQISVLKTVSGMLRSWQMSAATVITCAAPTVVHPPNSQPCARPCPPKVHSAGTVQVSVCRQSHCCVPLPEILQCLLIAPGITFRLLDKPSRFLHELLFSLVCPPLPFTYWALAALAASVPQVRPWWRAFGYGARRVRKCLLHVMQLHVMLIFNCLTRIIVKSNLSYNLKDVGKKRFLEILTLKHL